MSTRVTEVDQSVQIHIKCITFEVKLRDRTLRPSDIWLMVEQTHTTLSYGYVSFNVLHLNNECLSIVPCCLRILSNTWPGHSESFRRVPFTSEVYGVNVSSTSWGLSSGGPKLQDSSFLHDPISWLPVGQNTHPLLTVSLIRQDRSRRK